MLQTLIFSKNRACQLELLLRSMDKPENRPAIVLYTYDPGFERGYQKVIEMYSNVEFIKETSFKEQLLEITKNSDYIMLLADDDVFINKFYEETSEFSEFKNNENIISLSLALCPKYVWNGSPKLENNKWEWFPYRKNKWYHLRIWGFPMAIIGNIFRTKDIYPIMEKGSIDIPNDLEGVLTRNPPDKPLMICYEEPRVINNKANQVQKKFSDVNFGTSVEELEKEFLKGVRLSLEDIKEKAKNASSYHLVTDYKYEYNNSRPSQAT